MTMGPQKATDLDLEGLAHDLNNVFETIRDTAEILAGEPRFTKLAASIRRSVTRGERMLESYLERQLASLELEQILKNAEEFIFDFVHAVPTHTFEFHHVLEPGLRLRGDASDWERVMINLFLNAAQAMESGGVVQVEARRLPEGIEVVVSDEGPGIPARNLPKIFEAHFSTKSKRLGLGLHIVQTIVNRNGGSVTAANHPEGRGAQFRLLLPPA